jgi:hypothetical protein
MEEYVANVNPRQYFYENLSRAIKKSDSFHDVIVYLESPFHSLDKEPFNSNDKNFIYFIVENLKWMKNYKMDKEDLIYWVNSMICNIGNGSV